MHKEVEEVKVLSDSGMSTVEYAIGTLVAAALAMVLWGVVSGTQVADALLGLVTRALEFEP